MGGMRIAALVAPVSCGKLLSVFRKKVSFKLAGVFFVFLKAKSCQEGAKPAGKFRQFFRNNLFARRIRFGFAPLFVAN